MLKLNKYENNNNFDVFEIETKEGKIKISLEDNFDLYWQYINVNKEEEKELYITKEDYFIYTVFNDLYTAIKENKPWYNYPSEHEIKDKQVKFNKYPTSNDNTITFISDDGHIETGSRLIIEKTEEDIFKIIFKKGKIADSFFNTYAIRISNSGSRYEPFNITFMNMYNKLKEYNYENHQIHMEEYIYSKKKIKEKK